MKRQRLSPSPDRQRLSPSPDRFQKGNNLRGSSRGAIAFSSSHIQSQSDRGRASQLMKRRRSSPSFEISRRDNDMRGSSGHVPKSSSYNQSRSDRGRASQRMERRRSSPSLEISQRDNDMRRSSGQVSRSSFSYNQSQSDRGRTSQPMKRRRSSPSDRASQPMRRRRSSSPLELSQRDNYMMRGSSAQVSPFSSSYNQSQSDRGRPSQPMKRQRQSASPVVIVGDNFAGESSRQMTTFISSYIQGNTISSSSRQISTPISSYSQGQSDSDRVSQSVKRERSPELSQGGNHTMIDNPSSLNSSNSKAFAKSLKVAIIDKLEPLTSRRADLVKAELTSLLDSTLLTKSEELPTFRALYFEQMQLKITCENKSSLDWLRDAVSRLPPLWEGAALDVISLTKFHLSNLIQATFWIPDTKDANDVILRRLAVQNPWANVESWSLIRKCKTPNGLLLIFGVDKVTENILKKHKMRLNYMFNSSQVRIQEKRIKKKKKKNSANQARSKVDAPKSAEVGEGRRRDY